MVIIDIILVNNYVFNNISIIGTENYYKLYVVIILGVVKRNPLFLHKIEWKNNGFLFITPNIIL